MPELTLSVYDAGLRPLRTETLPVPDDGAAVALARARLRSSRFTAASVYVDGAFVVQFGRDGDAPGSRDLASNLWRLADEDPGHIPVRNP